MLKRIIFWEPSVSPHKAQLFSAIKRRRPEVELLHIAQSDVSAERIAMGWTTPPPVGYQQVVEPNLELCRAVASANIEDSFHVFSGMRHVPCIVKGLRFAVSNGANFALMAEPRINEGLFGFLRFTQSLLMEGSLRRNSSCVFAIGRNGPPWFESVGYAKEKVFPFAYFVDPLQTNNPPLARNSDKLRVGYLGRLVRPKGIFVLIEAFRQVPLQGIELHLAGPMGDEEYAINQALQPIASCVHLHGPISMVGVATYLNSIDVLVLPSVTKDGWGVVVSEALLLGLPVIATTCVGAAIALRDERLGIVIAPNDPGELARAIAIATSPHVLNAEAREWRKAWAGKHLSADAGADYFWQVLDHCTAGARRPIPFYQDTSEK